MSAPPPPGGYPPRQSPRPPTQGGYPASPAPARHVASQPSAAYPTPNRPGAAPAFAQPATTTAPVTPVWQGPSSSGNTHTAMWVALVVLGFGALWGLWLVLSNVGYQPAVIGFLVALIPLAVVLATVQWLDRWEPEPRMMLLLGLLWGAGVSVIVAYYGNTWVAVSVYNATGDIMLADTISSVVSAPIVEETAKGVGVLLIFLLRRRYFDGVVDGIVYASVVAAGFAFTENILYFGQYVDVLASTFIGRGIMSPFAHILFTACTGIALGLASRNRSRYAAWWLFPIGLVCAMGLHALWNATSSLGEGFLMVYLLVQVPLFIAAVVLVVWLRRQEAKVIRDRLAEYAAAGWYAPHEVAMVASLRQRSQARSWASRMGPSAGNAMKAFIKDSTSLAYLRQRAVSGRADLRSHRTTEHDLLQAVVGDRRQFLAASGTRPPVSR